MRSYKQWPVVDSCRFAEGVFLTNIVPLFDDALENGLSAFSTRKNGVYSITTHQVATLLLYTHTHTHTQTHTHIYICFSIQVIRLGFQGIALTEHTHTHTHNIYIYTGTSNRKNKQISYI